MYPGNSDKYHNMFPNNRSIICHISASLILYPHIYAFNEHAHSPSRLSYRVVQQGFFVCVWGGGFSTRPIPGLKSMCIFSLLGLILPACARFFILCDFYLLLK